jgi:hypothetical protein
MEGARANMGMASRRCACRRKVIILVGGLRLAPYLPVCFVVKKEIEGWKARNDETE